MAQINKCGFNPLVECNNECRYYDTCTRNPNWKSCTKTVATIYRKDQNIIEIIKTEWLKHTEGVKEINNDRAD